MWTAEMEFRSANMRFRNAVQRHPFKPAIIHIPRVSPSTARKKLATVQPVGREAKSGTLEWNFHQKQIEYWDSIAWRYNHDHPHGIPLDGTSMRLDPEEHGWVEYSVALYGMWIYFIESESQSRVKIGITGDLAKRLAGLRASSPVDDLVLITQLQGTGSLEHRLHQEFSADRLHGEWFHKSDKLLLCIEHIKRLNREYGTEFSGKAWLGTPRYGAA
jgi:T5orf172 domain